MIMMLDDGDNDYNDENNELDEFSLLVSLLFSSTASNSRRYNGQQYVFYKSLTANTDLNMAKKTTRMRKISNMAAKTSPATTTTTLFYFNYGYSFCARSCFGKVRLELLLRVPC